MELIKVGPVGSCNGSIWDEKGRDEVAGILISYSEDTIESIQFLFYENGNLVQSNKHGSHSSCENFSAVVFDYPSEFLTLLSGSYGSSMYSTGLEVIKFNTNKDSYGPFGCTPSATDAKHFNFQLGNHHLFGGFHGTMNECAIDSIGIYVKPDIPSMINLKDLRVNNENEED